MAARGSKSSKMESPSGGKKELVPSKRSVKRQVSANESRAPTTASREEVIEENAMGDVPMDDPMADSMGDAVSDSMSDHQGVNILDIPIVLVGCEGSRNLRDCLTTGGSRMRKLVLICYPKAATPGCTKQVKIFNENLSSITAAGFRVIGVSLDTMKAQTSFRSKEQLDYPLVAQGKDLLKVINALNVQDRVIRSVVAVDESGKIIYEQHKVKPVECLAEFLDFAKTTTTTTTTTTRTSAKSTAKNDVRNEGKNEPKPSSKSNLESASSAVDSGETSPLPHLVKANAKSKATGPVLKVTKKATAVKKVETKRIAETKKAPTKKNSTEARKKRL